MTTGSSPSYLLKEPYSYYFRIRIPRQLQKTLARKELRYSMGTGILSDAKTKARYLAGQTQLLFKKIETGCFETMELTDLQIQEMVKKFLRERIQHYDKPSSYEKYIDPSENLPDEDEWTGGWECDEWDPDWRTQDERYDPSFETQEELEETIDFIEKLKAKMNLHLQKGNHRLAQRNADLLLRAEGYRISDIRRTSTSYAKLCSGIYRAWIKSLDYWKDKLQGNFNDELEDALNDCLTRESEQTIISQELYIPSAISQPPLPSLSVTEKQSITVKELIPQYIAEGKADKRWSGKTPDEIESALNAFAELIGQDTPVSSIDRDIMLDYKEKLRSLPPANKIPNGVSLLEAAQLDYPITLAAKTINKRLEFTSGFLNYAVDKNLLQHNPSQRLKIKENQRNTEKRDAFSTEDLNKIFRSVEYLKDAFDLYYRFWGPVIGLYTGARLDEICQLHLSDFQEHDGIVCIDINDDAPDKKLKNLASKRIIPLHPLLTDDLKIMSRVEQMKQRGAKRFFHTFSKSKDGYGRTLGRWFNDYLKPIGVYEKYKKTFHSFRHTLSNNLKQQLIEPTLVDELTGHAIEGESMGRYGKRYGVDVLYQEGILKLNYGLDHHT